MLAGSFLAFGLGAVVGLPMGMEAVIGSAVAGLFAVAVVGSRLPEPDGGDEGRLFRALWGGLFGIPLVILWHLPTHGVDTPRLGVQMFTIGSLLGVTFCEFRSTVLLGSAIGGVLGTALVQSGRPESVGELAGWASVVGCCLASALGAAVANGPEREDARRISIVWALGSVFVVSVMLRMAWWFWMR